MKLKRLLCAALAALLLGSCAAPAASQPETDAETGRTVTLTDALGVQTELQSWDRVVSLYGSFAELWLLSGGTLVGATTDAVEERGLALGEEVALVGNVKTPSLEEVLALEPDFVILSADIEGHVALADSLTAAGVPHAYFRVDSFEDYCTVLGQFCQMTGRDDLYAEYGTAQRERVERILAAVQALEADPPTVLLIRAYSTGAKAKGSDIFAGAMLEELGAVNLVSRYGSLLDDLSLETIIAADPDRILMVPMGANEDAAAAYMAEHFESNPAWAGLTAVQNGRYEMLPKELFHYKPNARWADSYAYLARVLYPQLTGEDLR